MNNAIFHEVNFDGLPGPAHNFAGLAGGNIASARHEFSVSNPRKAALQGLDKMQLLLDSGLKQAVIPPQERPHIGFLRELGFSGPARGIPEKVMHANFRLLAAAYSSSAMWTANAAIVTPSPDSQDGRVHFTPANLSANLHRSLEAEQTMRYFRTVFADESRFAVHAPLPAALPDEGAANFSRICSDHGDSGFELFVYGRSVFERSEQGMKYSARQSREAFESIIRRHRIIAPHLLAQNMEAIQAGVFHNDVISTGDRDLFLYHERTFAHPEAATELRELGKKNAGVDLKMHKIDEDEISLSECVDSYIFNSQIVSLPNGERLMLAPWECSSLPGPRDTLHRLLGEPGGIQKLSYVKLTESMKNGGGPACLRLRVVLSQEEIAAAHPGVFLDTALLASLRNWVQKHYRSRLTWQELQDPALMDEGRRALDELTDLLDLGNSYYPFQRE